MTEDKIQRSRIIKPVSEVSIANVAATLRGNNIYVRVVDTREEAKRLVLELVPEGAEVH